MISHSESVHKLENISSFKPEVANRGSFYKSPESSESIRTEASAKVGISGGELQLISNTI